MKKCVFFICMVLLCGGIWSCSESGSDEPSIEDLQKQIADLKRQLEQNTKITKVAFEGDQMVLTFADGTVLKTATPSSVIPNIGENGNWWVNGQDLGIKAKAQIPVIGSNGNWWCDGVDTGKSAQGDKGDKGDKGDNGRGIQKIEYDSATGILKITLTDGTPYEFGLTVSGDGSGNLGGNKLDDNNGSYLLTKIYNGDFPFAAFTYDGANKMTGVTYYQNVLNAPQKYMEMTQEYNSNNKVASQKFTEYALKSTSVAQEWDDFLDRHYVSNELEHDPYILKTADQLYVLLFPSGLDGYNNSHATKTEVLEFLLGYNKEMNFYDTNFVYSVKLENNQFYLSQHVRKQEYGNNVKHSFKFVKEQGQYYYYGNYYDEYYGWSNTQKKDVWATSTSSYRFVPSDYAGGWNIENNGESKTCYYFAYLYKYAAFKYTGNEDEKNGNILKDYYTPDADLVYNVTGETGKFKILKRTYRTYQPGEQMRSTTLNYAYNGNDFDIQEGSRNNCFVKMSGDKIDEVMSYQDGTKKQFLKFNYNADGKLLTVDAPGENLTGVAKFIYDERKNPIEFQVNVDKLQGKGYDDILCDLGLAYRYLDYDATLGLLVEKVKYASGNQAVLKVNYNYGLKNFMNHTFTALNPILNTFNLNNAISELVWAGHGSCLMTEYSDYNDGGYPTRLKGILQLSDQIFEEGFDINAPINGSVATLYKLEYQKKN